MHYLGFMRGGYGGGFGLINLIWGALTLIFWIAIVIGIFMLIHRASNSTWMNENNEDKKQTALNILKERYAKGEIDKAEFEEKKKDLAE
jgi:putative membrane protein